MNPNDDNIENDDAPLVDFPRGTEQDARDLCDVVPEGPAIEGVLDLFTHWHRIDAEHTELVLRDGARIELVQGDKNLIARYTRTTKSGQVIAEVMDLSKLTETNIAAKRVLNYALTETKKVMRDGKPTIELITFPLEKLIEVGMYRSERTARRGFATGAETLRHLSVGGTVLRGAKPVETDVDSFFTGYKVSTKRCAIKLNTGANWDLFMQYFMVLPRFFYKLGDHAGDLFRHIWYRARIEVTKGRLKNGEPFYVSLEKVHDKLGLPPINGVNTPTRDIKVAIDNALEEIETEHSKTFHNTDLALLLVHKDTKKPLEDCNIRNYIGEGQLQVTIKGGLLKYLKRVSGANKRHKTPPTKIDGEVTDAPSEPPQPQS